MLYQLSYVRLFAKDHTLARPLRITRTGPGTDRFERTTGFEPATLTLAR